MATDNIQAAEAAILEKITTLTDCIRQSAQGYQNETLKLAAAVNQLAEARAWLRATAQPHGSLSLPQD